jgi:hypothetical protein
LNFAVGGLPDTIASLTDSGLANLNVNGGTLEIGTLNITDGLASGSNSVTFNGNGYLYIDTLNFGSASAPNNGTLSLTNSGSGDVQLGNGVLPGTGLSINDSLGNHTSTVTLDGAIGGTVQLAPGFHLGPFAFPNNVSLTLNAALDNDNLTVNLQGDAVIGATNHYGNGTDVITLGSGSDEVLVGQGVDTITFGTHAAGADSVDLAATIGNVNLPTPLITSVYTNGSVAGTHALDLVQGLATGDTLYFPAAVTTIAYVNNLSLIQSASVTFATGIEVGGINGQQFQYSAAGTDTLVTYNNGAVHESVVLVGIAEHSGAGAVLGGIHL